MLGYQTTSTVRKQWQRSRLSSSQHRSILKHTSIRRAFFDKGKARSIVKLCVWHIILLNLTSHKSGSNEIHMLLAQEEKRKIFWVWCLFVYQFLVILVAWCCGRGVNWQCINVPTANKGKGKMKTWFSVLPYYSLSNFFDSKPECLPVPSSSSLADLQHNHLTCSISDNWLEWSRCFYSSWWRKSRRFWGLPVTVWLFNDLRRFSPFANLQQLNMQYNDHEWLDYQVHSLPLIAWPLIRHLLTSDLPRTNPWPRHQLPRLPAQKCVRNVVAKKY